MFGENTDYEIYICTFSQPLVTFSSVPCSQNLQLHYFLLRTFVLFFTVSWQCVISTNSYSSAEAFTPTFCVHTILYQTETPTSEEVGITVGFRRRDGSSGGIFVPSEDNHQPTAGTPWTGVEGMTIICIKHPDMSKGNVFDLGSRFSFNLLRREYSKKTRTNVEKGYEHVVHICPFTQIYLTHAVRNTALLM